MGWTGLDRMVLRLLHGLKPMLFEVLKSQMRLTEVLEAMSARPREREQLGNERSAKD
jgi:hypothetical protein